MPNSAEWTTLHKYSESDQLLRVRVEQGGTVTYSKVYEYDSPGRLTRVLETDKEGRQRVAEKRWHEPDGSKRKITYIYIDPAIPAGTSMMYGVDGTDAGYSAPGATQITSIYDQLGRPIEHLFQDGDGRLVTRVEFCYNEQGNLIEEVYEPQTLALPSEMGAELDPDQREAIRTMLTFHRRHRYDGQGRKVESWQGRPPDDFYRNTFAYNDHGDLISDISESSNAAYDLEEDGAFKPKPDTTRSHRAETRLQYQYDSYGNWIEKIVEARGEIWSIDRRTIVYFE
jgi:YD repeat-containing protein